MYEVKGEREGAREARGKARDMKRPWPQPNGGGIFAKWKCVYILKGESGGICFDLRSEKA